MGPPVQARSVRVGFIIPALAEEHQLLAACLDRLRTAVAAVPVIVPHIIVVLQPSPGMPMPELAVTTDVEILHLEGRGVARARNRALDHLAGRVDALMFVDVAVRPGAAFLAAAVAQLQHDLLVSAPVAFRTDMPEPEHCEIGSVGAAFLIYRGFLWSSMMRAEALGPLRFLETIGPGTASRHQAGEDSRLIYQIVARNHLRRIPFLSTPVARLPRPNLSEKVTRYAYGQGYLVGQYLVHPQGGIPGFAYFAFRCVLFIGRSLAMLAQGRMRATGRERISAFCAGLRAQDKDVPPLQGR